jgi:hypothetical protein
MQKGLIATFMVALMLITLWSVNLSAYAITINEETTSTVSESFIKDYYVEITKIEPYLHILAPFWVVLCFTAELTNTGDEPYTGDIGYSATAKNIYGRVVDTSHITHSGGLNPGESWLDTISGYGLMFDGWYIPPKYYKLEFYSIPSNDYKMAKYKIFGNGIWFDYEYEQVNYTISDIVLRTIDYPFLQQFPLLNLLLERLRI